MSARAPQAIYSLWNDIHKHLPQAVLSGIVGDVHHSFGYHLARRDLPQSDYSVQLSLDRKGASDCASALDVSLPPDLMKICTRRLLAAAKAEDPRLKGLREFCGTLDGRQTYPWDLSTNSSEGIDTWDDSHLWHIHLSFYRAYADNYDVIAPIADVFTGIRQTQSQPTSPKPPLPQESDMPLILYVDRKDCAKRNITWPGIFLYKGDGTIAHIPTVAAYQAHRAAGCSMKTISVATYRGLGGK